MADWCRISPTPQLDGASGTCVWVDGNELALFQVHGEWFAVAGRCPHQGAALSNGPLNGTTLTCPLHDWDFDLRSGECLTHSRWRLATYAVRQDGDALWIDRESLPPPQPVVAPVTPGETVLVRYGQLGWIGEFTHQSLEFGERLTPVVIQTSRGTELGEYLGKSTSVSGSASPQGEVLRAASATEMEEYRQRAQSALQLIAEAQSLLDEQFLPVDVVDAELLFDGQTAVLYYLGEFVPEFAALRTELALKRELLRVDFTPLVDPPPSSGGGCGAEGCGCKTAAEPLGESLTLDRSTALHEAVR